MLSVGAPSLRSEVVKSKCVVIGECAQKKNGVIKDNYCVLGNWLH